MKRGIVVALSDIHSGHRSGLMNPDTLVKDTDGVRVPVSKLNGYSEWNNYLWHDVYMWGFDLVKKLAKRSPVYVIHNGDLTQGDKYNDQLVSTRLSDQIILAADCMRVWTQMSNVKALRLTTGTPSHVMGESSATELVASILSAEQPKKDIISTDHTLAKISGVTFDYSHHGPSPGTKTWVSGNAARSYAKDIMLQELLHGNQPPDVILRSHYHQYLREIITMLVGENEYVSQMVITPSLCLLGDHGRQVMRSVSRVVNGMIAFEIIDGRVVELHKFIKVVDVRRREVYDLR